MDEAAVTRLPMFTREEYDRVRAAIIDPYNLHADYSAFVAFIQQREQSIHYAGGASERVQIDLERLEAFCAEIESSLSSNAVFYFALLSGKGLP